MTRAWLIVLVVSVVLIAALCWYGISHYRADTDCRNRGTAFDAKVEALRRDAHENLKVGTKQAGIVRFFSRNHIPLSFLESLATGDIHVRGCAPFNCDSDDGLIGVRVEIDKKGTVRSEPVIVARYQGCY
jgi:hypothetical protein